MMMLARPQPANLTTSAIRAGSRPPIISGTTSLGARARQAVLPCLPINGRCRAFSMAPGIQHRHTPKHRVRVRRGRLGPPVRSSKARWLRRKRGERWVQKWLVVVSFCWPRWGWPTEGRFRSQPANVPISNSYGDEANKVGLAITHRAMAIETQVKKVATKGVVPTNIQWR